MRADVIGHGELHVRGASDDPMELQCYYRRLEQAQAQLPQWFRCIEVVHVPSGPLDHAVRFKA